MTSVRLIARAAAFFAIGAILHGCSSQTETRSKRATGLAASFTAEDRRVAQALSVWQRYVPENETPLDRAALCEIAIKAMAERLEGTAVLSDDQRQAVRVAQAIYARRRMQERPTDAQVQASAQKAEQGLPDQSSRLRMAVNCLRDLA